MMLPALLLTLLVSSPGSDMEACVSACARAMQLCHVRAEAGRKTASAAVLCACETEACACVTNACGGQCPAKMWCR
jgi:hypothetical protein